MAFNINRFTEKSQEAVVRAQHIAEELNHSQVEPEHLFAALLQQDEGVVPQVLQRLGANPRDLLQQVQTELDHQPKVSGSGVQVGYHRAYERCWCALTMRSSSSAMNMSALSIAARFDRGRRRSR